MGLYRIYKLDDANDENSNGSFIQVAVVDSDFDMIGALGTGEGFDENGILHQWNPPDGCIAVKHPEAENQPEPASRRFADA